MKLKSEVQFANASTRLVVIDAHVASDVEARASRVAALLAKKFFRQHAMELEAAVLVSAATSPLDVRFANESTAPVLVGFCNEITIGDDGWAMIAPFGDHPSTALILGADGKVKKQNAIQRIDKAGCEAMVASFHNERRGLRKFLKGCNIYVGHPDVPGLGAFYPDKEPKGVFADMAVRADGLYGLPVFTNDGSEIVETKKLRAFSGNLGESEPCGAVNGVPAYRPTKIFSAGLTNHPHLPVHFFNSDDTLADAHAEAATNQHKHTMKKKLAALFAALFAKQPQFANAEAPTEAETEAALDQISEKVAAFANEKAKLESGIAERDTKINTLTAANGTLTTERDTARTTFANERAARIADALTDALTTGRITDAERATWETRLNVEANFANENTALRKLAAKVKTTSVTVSRGGREQAVDVSTPEARAQFVNEAMTETAKELGLDAKKDYDAVHAAVQRRYPAIFAAMQQPEIKVRKQK